MLAQLLGFMHQVTHGGMPSIAVPQAASAEAAHADHHARAWTQALFALHDDDTDCRLYDASGLPALACHTPPALPVIAPVAAFVRLLDAGFVARRAALFDARGPPASR